MSSGILLTGVVGVPQCPTTGPTDMGVQWQLYIVTYRGEDRWLVDLTT